jgi:glycosyltransferase involved in cell wall biosynthesis
LTLEEFLQETTNPLTSRTAHLGILVSSTSLSSGREDLFVAINLAKALLRHGQSVAIIGPASWGKDELLPMTLLVMLPTVDITSIPNLRSRRIVGWARNNFEKWGSLKGAAFVNKIFATSPRGMLLLRSRLGANVVDSRVISIGSDLDFFSWSDADKVFDVVISSSGSGSGAVWQYVVEPISELTNVHFFGNAPQGYKLPSKVINHGPVDYDELPKIYGGAKIVIDPLPPGNLRFGPLNSRFFDVVSAGAIPLTNTRPEIVRSGLGHLPSWRDQGGLYDLCSRLLTDDFERISLLKKSRLLRESVSTESTTAPLIEYLLAKPDPIRPVRIVYPDYRSTNKFLELKYACDQNVKAEAIFFTSHFDSLLEIAASPGPRCLAIDFHWLEPLVMTDSLAMAIRRVNKIQILLQNKGKLLIDEVVFNFHNTQPHEPKRLRLYRLAVRLFLRGASKVTLMNSKSLEILGETSEAEISYDVHPSYTATYTDLWTPKSSKRALNLPPEKIVVGIVGALRQYKGVLELVQGFNAVSPQHVHLILAGRAEPADFKRDLLDAVKESKDVTICEGFIPDWQLMKYVRSLDVALLPFKSILNSGSLQLFRDAGIPTLVPAVLRDLGFQSDVGYFESIEDCLRKLDKFQANRLNLSE